MRILHDAGVHPVDVGPQEWIAPVLPGEITDFNRDGVASEVSWKGTDFKLFERARPRVTYVLGEFTTAQAEAGEAKRRLLIAKDLVGSQLLRNFAPGKGGAWKGKVFVPDLNVTVSGTAELIDPNTLKARGCVFAGIGCKSQNWKRVQG